MPVQYKNLFFTENAVAHIRIKQGLYYEIRCQIDGKKITVTSKELATAKKKFIEKLHNLTKQKEIPEENPTTFFEYGSRWLETVKRPTVKQTTYEDYLSTFRVHLFPAFGARNIKTLSRTELQEYLNKLVEQGKSRAAHKQKQLLTSLFEYAEFDELISRSPMEKIKLPIHESENGTALSSDEEREFVKRCLDSDTRSGKAFCLFYTPGCADPNSQRLKSTGNG